ncbi:hypothetical protein RB195_009170 [Necator americanus]|uniref:Uncharacterized protein n=1 Tax=Necator americanus TaxID=51031 RepID=A0ABR1CUM9_NECAM
MNSRIGIVAASIHQANTTMNSRIGIAAASNSPEWWPAKLAVASMVHALPRGYICIHQPLTTGIACSNLRMYELTDERRSGCGSLRFTPPDRLRNANYLQLAAAPLWLMVLHLNVRCCSESHASAP